MQALDDNDQQLIDYERIRFLFDHIKYGNIGTVAAALFIFVALFGTLSLSILGVWFGIFLIALLPRIVLGLRFNKRVLSGAITHKNVKAWERWLILSTAVLNLILVSAIYFPTGEGEAVGVLYCAFALMSLTAGAVIILSTSLPLIRVFLTIVFSAIFFRFLLLQEALYFLLALFVVLGFVLSLSVTFRQHRMIVENIATKLENRRNALIDPLTSLWNRRRLNLHVEKLVPAVQRGGQPFTLIVLDIDQFKQYNDAHGHSQGDVLLRSVAQILQECSRQQDLVVRYGGEEFVILSPNTSIAEGVTMAERICNEVRDRTEVTISAGLAEYQLHLSFEELFELADSALYTAKQRGRDRYILAKQ